MASMHFHYAVKEYGPYVASHARDMATRELAAPRVYALPPPIPTAEDDEPLKHQFNPTGIPRIKVKAALGEGEE